MAVRLNVASFDLTADDLRAVLRPDADAEPVPDGPTAAVAAVFRKGLAGTELLFIQRAVKATDPWSGQMALPGGRRDASDRDSRHTAERETSEELAVDLSRAERIGSLDDVRPGFGRGGLVAVHAHGYWLDGPAPEMTPNYEIADALWVPLAQLGDADRYIDYHYPPSDSTWPGIQLDDPGKVVWGLTLRMLSSLFTRLGEPFVQLAPPANG